MGAVSGRFYSELLGWSMQAGSDSRWALVLARYRELVVLRVTRGEPEMYVRHLVCCADGKFSCRTGR
jgi:hypothetical protein